MREGAGSCGCLVLRSQGAVVGDYPPCTGGEANGQSAEPPDACGRLRVGRVSAEAGVSSAEAGVSPGRVS